MLVKGDTEDSWFEDTFLLAKVCVGHHTLAIAGLKTLNIQVGSLWVTRLDAIRLGLANITNWWTVT